MIRSIIPHDQGTGRERSLRLAAGLLVLAGLSGGCSGVEEVTEAITPSPPASSPTVATPVPVQDPAIAIRTPLENDEVSAPVSVTGTTDVDGGVTVRVLGRGGAELAAIDVDCRKACPGTFGTELFFFVDRRERGWIEVSGTTADGRRAVSTVPVVLLPG